VKLIQILGPGCPRCNQLAQNVRSVVDELDLPYAVEKVTDINKISTFGVMITPALAVDGEVKSAGKVLSVPEIKQLIA